MTEPTIVGLDERRLAQERQLKERELALREREIEYQQRSRTPWSTPVVASVGGVLGYMGTFISSCESRQIEREKQQGTLIIDAIRTAGSGAEKEKQTAFFDDKSIVVGRNLAADTEYAADRLAMRSWQHLNGSASDFGRPSFYVNQLVSTATSMGINSTEQIREAFSKRNLQ